jgi:hypothetical protein
VVDFVPTVIPTRLSAFRLLVSAICVGFRVGPLTYLFAAFVGKGFRRESFLKFGSIQIFNDVYLDLLAESFIHTFG